MEFPRSLSLPVRLMPSADLREVALDLCELSRRLGVKLEADFNGVLLWASPGDSPQRLMDAYHEQQQRSSHLVRIAQAG